MVVGGFLLAPVLLLIVQPVLIDVFSKRATAGDLPRATEEPAK
jgi:hypothetical protein